MDILLRPAPLLLGLVGLTVSACAELGLEGFGEVTPAAAAAAAVPDEPVVTLDPTPPPRPPATARTADQFDTTTDADRTEALAAAPAPAGEERLGTTLATLGSPADPGIWIETPYVTAVTPGRVEVAGTGKTINIELRPSGGAPGSGSQISLPAMRLLELPLTAIQELVVFRLPTAA